MKLKLIAMIVLFAIIGTAYGSSPQISGKYLRAYFLKVEYKEAIFSCQGNTEELSIYIKPNATIEGMVLNQTEFIIQDKKGDTIIQYTSAIKETYAGEQVIRLCINEDYLTTSKITLVLTKIKEMRKSNKGASVITKSVMPIYKEYRLKHVVDFKYM